MEVLKQCKHTQAAMHELKAAAFEHLLFQLALTYNLIVIMSK